MIKMITRIVSLLQKVKSHLQFYILMANSVLTLYKFYPSEFCFHGFILASLYVS